MKIFKVTVQIILGIIIGVSCTIGVLFVGKMVFYDLPRSIFETMAYDMST